MWTPRPLIVALFVLMPCVVSAWQVQSQSLPQPQPQPERAPSNAEQLTAIGKLIFFDRSLSKNGQVACASCHDPTLGYGPPHDLAQRLRATRYGDAFRATPSLRYLQSPPPYSVDASPTGGHTWDGRVDTAHEQARLPLMSATEMDNDDEAAVVRKLQRAPYASQLRAAFGTGVFDDPMQAYAAATRALEVFQQSPRDFHPYNSKYDAVLRGRAELTRREARGLALFNDRAKGNCASCHLSTPSAGSAFPLFTNFDHVAIGVPRNKALRANANPGFFDLGLCGPLRDDYLDKPEAASYCGRFRTPGLRNVALRNAYFHNGAIRTLEEAVRFHVTRDTDPARWYGRDRLGRPYRYDDLPPQYHGNLATDAPFGGKPGPKPGERPALDDREIADIVAFLKTLTDADLKTVR